MEGFYRMLECTIALVGFSAFIYLAVKQELKRKAIRKQEAMAKGGHRWHHNVD